MNRFLDWLFPWRRKLRELQERSRQVEHEMSIVKQRCDWLTERCTQALARVDATIGEVRLHMPKATEAHVDMEVGGWNDMHDCTVVLLGRWRGRDYVRIIPVRASIFSDTVRYLGRFAREHELRYGHIDAGIYSDQIRQEVPHE